MTALDVARQNGKNEVVALLSEPRYARRQRRASDRLRAARAAARRRGHMRARAVVSICVPAIACRWRTNGCGSPWGLTGSSPRSTTLPMERLDTTHVLPSSCLVAVRVRSAVVGAPGVGGGAAARWPSVAAEVGRAGRPPRTAAPPTAATLPCQRALRALARACLPAMTRRAGHHCTAPTCACARAFRNRDWKAEAAKAAADKAAADKAAADTAAAAKRAADKAAADTAAAAALAGAHSTESENAPPAKVAPATQPALSILLNHWGAAVRRCLSTCVDRYHPASPVDDHAA